MKQSRSRITLIKMKNIYTENEKRSESGIVLPGKVQNRKQFICDPMT